MASPKNFAIKIAFWDENWVQELGHCARGSIKTFFQCFSNAELSCLAHFLGVSLRSVSPAISKRLIKQKLSYSPINLHALFCWHCGRSFLFPSLELLLTEKVSIKVQLSSKTQIKISSYLSCDLFNGFSEKVTLQPKLIIQWTDNTLENINWLGKLKIMLKIYFKSHFNGN